MTDKTTVNPDNPTDKDGKPLVSMGDLNVSADDKDGKPAAKEAAPETVEVKLGAKSYTIPTEVATALKAAEKAGADVEAFKSQVASLSKQVEAMKPKPESKVEDGYSTLLFTDPDKAIAKLTEEITEKLRGEIRATESERMFWDEFYNQNKDLKDYDEYVRFVYARDRAGLIKSGVTVAEAITKIAEASKTGLLKLRGGVPLNGKSKEVAEGGSDGNSRRKPASKDGKEEGEAADLTTADILAKRREARRLASKPGKRA